MSAILSNLKVSILVTMKQEFHPNFKLPHNHKIVYTGIGKVNSAIFASTTILEDRPDLIINFGTVGCKKFNRGTLLNPKFFIQRDVDLSSIIKKKYKLLGDIWTDDNGRLEYGLTDKNLLSATLGTGDSVDTSLENNSFYDCVDMEAYSIALACKIKNTPFLCVKYVSDGADENANLNFQDSLKNANKTLLNYYQSILNRIPNKDGFI